MVQYISERHRKPARRKNADYSRQGCYFVTVVTLHRYPRFGTIVNGIEWLNEAGVTVEQAWFSLPKYVPGIQLDEFIVMPNHVHGVVFIEPHEDSSVRPSLSEVMKAFKSLSANAYSKGVINRDREPFDRHLWQRSYHGQIIRDIEHLDHVRTYIANNPKNWQSDEEHPKQNPR